MASATVFLFVLELIFWTEALFFFFISKNPEKPATKPLTLVKISSFCPPMTTSNSINNYTFCDD